MIEFFINDKVWIDDHDHPWHNHTGTITRGLRKPMSFMDAMYTVRIDDIGYGHDCMAKPKSLRHDRRKKR